MKRAGAATARMSRGSIRLVFELRKRRKLSTSDMLQWEPILCLHDRECSIDEVDLVFEGDGGLTWVINKITSLFKTSLRDYVVRSVLDILAEKSGWLLENLNKIMRNYWEIVLKVAGLSLVRISPNIFSTFYSHVLSKLFFQSYLQGWALRS
jgi:hypothetical protein